MPRVKPSYVQSIFLRNKKASYPIVKGNEIVQNAHINMPLADQKVLDSMIASIKPNQKTLTVRFSAYEFADMLGIKKTSNRLAYIMAVLQRVDKDNFWVKMPNGHYQIWRWLDKVDVDPKNKALCTVRFKPYLRKYLLSKSFKYRTVYEFSEIMHMKNRYSPRLFEIFVSNMSRQKRPYLGLNYNLNELRQGLNLMKRTKTPPYHVKRDKNHHIKYRYPRANDFMTKVIRPAVKEINKLTNFDVGCHIIRGDHNRIKALNVQMVKKNKQELITRRNKIIFITNHIAKKDQPHWQKVIIDGKFSPITKKNFAKVHHLKQNYKGQYHVYSYMTDKYLWVTLDQAKMILKLNNSLAKNENKQHPQNPY